MRPSLAANLFIAMLVVPISANAQDEANLRQALEGTRLTLRIDMPASTEGVDIYPGASRPLDFQKYGGRVKKHGAAIQSGESALITKIRVRGEHIEVQLDGGGYGTFGDVVNNWSSANGADSGAAQQAKRANDRTDRLSGGSRFNVRYPNGVTPAEMHAHALAEALAEYAEFPERLMRSGNAQALAIDSPDQPTTNRSQSLGDSGFPQKGMSVDQVARVAGQPTSSRSDGSTTTNRYSAPNGDLEVEFFRDVAVEIREVPPAPRGALRKGLSVAEVEEMAGKPRSTTTSDEVVTSTYPWQGGSLEAEFYKGVLVAYTISSD